MERGWSPLRRALLLACAASIATACGGGGGTGPNPSPPVITITGVSNGAVVEGPVTVTISVDRGSYTATLNGETFFSGASLSTPGDYLLVVEARSGSSTSSESISFRIAFGEGGVLIIRVIDLGANASGGGGDAILLTDSTDVAQLHVLIDAGPSGPGGVDRAFVQRRLQQLGVLRLEAVVLTHAHTDHFDGMVDVLNQIQVERFLYNGQARNFDRYEEVVALADARAGQLIVVDQLADVVLGDPAVNHLQVLPPLPTYLADLAASSSQQNEGSLGAALSRGTFTMFFTGDGEVEANVRWRTQFPALTGSLTALKVGHHGANDAVFDNGSFGASAWLTHVDPELQVITANGTSHPRIRALDLLLGRVGADTYCTNVHGDIEIRVDIGGQYVVTVERNAAMACEPGDDATT